MAEYQLKIGKEGEEYISNIINNLFVKSGIRPRRIDVLLNSLALLDHAASMTNKGYSLCLYDSKTNNLHQKIDLTEIVKLETGFVEKSIISKIVEMSGIGMKKYIVNEKTNEGISEIISNLYVSAGVKVRGGAVIRHALIMLEYASSMANKGYSLVLYDPKTNKVHQEIVF